MPQEPIGTGLQNFDFAAKFSPSARIASARIASARIASARIASARINGASRLRLAQSRAPSSESQGEGEVGARVGPRAGVGEASVSEQGWECGQLEFC